MIGERSYNYKKEHKSLEEKNGQIVCSHCGKVVEDREMPDYGIFMGSVWVKQNLPCKPYSNTGSIEKGE